MAGFTETVLQKKLAALNKTLPSIQTLSLWLLHHRKHSATIVKVWYGEFKKEKQSLRLLNLVHLANDVIQNSRKKWPPFQEQFQEILEKSFAHIARHSNAQILPSFRRVMDVWREREVFDKEFLAKLTYAVTSNLTKDLLTLFNENAAKTPPMSSSTPTTLSTTKLRTHKQKSDESFDATTPPIEAKKSKKNLPSSTTTTPDTTPTSSTKTLINLRSPEDIIADAPSTEDLLKALKELENAASADVETRERIAQFPPDVADPSKLRHISSQLQAERFSSLVNEADQLLGSYNQKLVDEMSSRKLTLELLQKYLLAQKCNMDKDAEQLLVWKEKLVQLTNEKNDLHRHVESLPDLSKLPDFTQLTPLPSVGDLFTK